MTTIEWTQRPGTKGESWNPIRARHRETGKVGWFCVHASEGCRNCYAEAMNRWRGNGAGYREQDRGRVEVFLDEKALEKPLKWRDPRTIFVCSMTDLFAPWHTHAMLDPVFAVMALSPRHTYQVLTKRPDQIRSYYDAEPQDAINSHAGVLMDWDDMPGDVRWPMANLWLGTSVESRKEIWRIDELRRTPAAVRFLSLEPLLEDLGELDLSGIHWVIVGGESGPKARPMHPDWVRRIRDDCRAAGVPFFFKQWGEFRPATDDEIPERFGRECDDFRCMCSNGNVGSLSIAEAFHHSPRNWPQCFPHGADGDASCKSVYIRRVSKAAAGAILDGREWREFPA